MSRFETVLDELNQFDVTKFASIDSSNWVVVENTEQRLKSGLEQTPDMLLSACEKNQGLLLSIDLF